MATIFDKIIAKEIPARIVYEDEQALAFYDIAPKAPVHVLIIPKTPIVGLNTSDSSDSPVLAHLLAVANTVADQLGVRQSGYRLITNAGVGAGQEVMHLHFHLLADPAGGKLPGF